MARTYDASDIKELMDNTGGWAKNWDQVLEYLKGPAVRDSDFAKDEVPEMIHDVEKLKKEGFGFTNDYRKIWHKISGEDTSGMDQPGDMKPTPTNPIELKDKYLKGLDFPASKAQVIDKAKANDAPERVMKVLKKLEDEKYKNMPGLLEAVGDIAWDH